MSKESVTQFLEKVVEDEEFSRRLEAASNREERMTLVREAGYEFTQDEFDGVTSELMSAADLSDDDLADVAGGRGIRAAESVGGPSWNIGGVSAARFFSRMPKWLVSGMRPPRGDGPDPSPRKGAYCGFFDCPV